MAYQLADPGLAIPAGLEPATSGSGTQRAIRLRYGIGVPPHGT